MSKSPFSASRPIHISISRIFNRWRGHAHSAPGTLSSPNTNAYPAAPPVPRPHIGPTAGPSNAPRYDPSLFAPPRNPALPRTTSSPHAPATLPRPPGMTAFFNMIQISNFCIAIRFKPSPFFQIDQAVSNVVECPGMRSQLTDITMLNTTQSLLVLATVVNKCYYFP